MFVHLFEENAEQIAVFRLAKALGSPKFYWNTLVSVA